MVGRTEDVSSAGISFVAEYGIRIKDAVRLHFFIPGNSKRISLHAAVMRKIPLPDKKYFYGAKLLEIEQAMGQSIQNFIDRVK